MVLTNTEKEIKGILRSEGLTQSEIALRRGVTKQTISEAIKRPAIVKGYAEMLEAMGYDIEINFIRRG